MTACSLLRKNIVWVQYYVRCAFCVVLLLNPILARAQLYFFQGFPDAAGPSTWYSTPEGLGAGFGGMNFAGQNLFVLSGRHAVVNTAMLLNGGTITVQSGGQLTVVGNIVGGGTIIVNAGGVLRLESGAIIAAGTVVMYNAGSSLLFTGSAPRTITNTSPEMPISGVAANVTFYNTATTGVSISGVTSLSLNGSVTVSSGTVQIDNSSVIVNGVFRFRDNGNCTLVNGVPSITFTSAVNLAEGQFTATTGVGSITFTGAGTIEGALRIQTGTTPATALQQVTVNRNASCMIGSSCSVGTLQVLPAGASVTVMSGQTLTVFSTILTAAGTTLTINGTLTYTQGPGTATLNGNVSVAGILQVELAGVGGAGTMFIQNGGRLRTAFPITMVVDYASSSALLEYVGTNTIIPNVPPQTEFPTTMNGSVVIAMSSTGRVHLNGNYTLRGNLTVTPSGAVSQPTFGLLSNSSLTLKGTIITQSGTPTLGVADFEQGTVHITIDSVVSTPIENFSIRPLHSLTGEAALRSFTLNRPTKLTLASTLVIGPETAYPNVISSTLHLRR
ncbi:MAG: hypothetical protein RML40_09365, partial [Bacteroidota bacterium]|nr:hypothetical protein [Bacteroidota bacterium]